MDSVFLLWHVHEVESVEDSKLIGVYRSEEDVKSAIERLKYKPGFDRTLGGFTYEKYQVNLDHWTEGFVQASSDD
jgi:hypothetical protein